MLKYWAQIMLVAMGAAAAYGREAPFGYATEQSVREACGESLKSNDGGFGCTLVQDGELRDYRCNESGRVGCRVEFRGAPGGASATEKGR